MKVRITLTSLLLVVTTIVALNIGSSPIHNLWRYLFNPNYGVSDLGHLILWQIRIPRILAAIFIGALLGIAGAIAQSATNNPLADPSILGTSAGASLGVVFGVVLNLVEIGSWQALILAIIGALTVTAFTFVWSRSAASLIIIGIGTSAAVTAMVGLLISATNNPAARSVSFWSFGSLALVNPSTLIMVIPIFLICLLIALRIAPELDLLCLGDLSVRHIGRSAQTIRIKAFVILAILIATSVSAVGSIAFLALAAPHIARPIFGARNRITIIGSALVGALILLAGDTIARTVLAPIELPIGLITSLIGAPVLIALVRKSSQIWQ